MENGKYRWVSNIVIFCLLIPFISCQNHSSQNDISEFNTSMLENGDIIYRLGDGIFSQYFKLTSKHEQLYSHSGIAVIHGSTISVIHSEASEITGIGKVKSEPISKFMRNISVWAIYRVDTTQHVRNNIASIATEYATKNTPFDTDFNLESDDKLYCTELVALCINKAMQRQLIRPTGLLRGNRYYSVDDTYLADKISLVSRQIK